MREFITNNLMLIHTGTAGQKITGVFMLSFFPAIGVSLMEKFTAWYIDNHIFIAMLIGAIIADLVAGVWKHLILHTFSFKNLLTGFIEKAGIIVLAYFLSESLVQIISDAELGSIYFKVICKLMIFSYPAGNAFVNMGIITDGKFPPTVFLNKFEKFNKTLDINIFKNKNNEKNNPTHFPDDTSSLPKQEKNDENTAI